MKKIFLFPISLLFISVSVIAQDTTYFDSNWNRSEKSQAKYYRVEQKINDLFNRTDYFLSENQIQMTGNYVSLNPEIKTGEFKWYHSNGKLRHTAIYTENLETGKHFWYFDTGKIEAIENYTSGKLNGEYSEYNKDGMLVLKSSFSEGIQSGFTTFYRENGLKHSEGYFKNGDRNGVWKFYDELGILSDSTDFKTDYVIEEANLFLKLPNSHWYLAEKDTNGFTQYIFKRAPITDTGGNNIVPAIMVYCEDASKYEQDVTLFSIEKRMSFKKLGLKIEKVLIHENEDYPLSYKNAFFLKCSYTAKGLDHVFYMIHIINKENVGIQIYLDITKSIAEEYEPEFFTTIKSLREH